jgi:hypothetical protein
VFRTFECLEVMSMIMIIFYLWRKIPGHKVANCDITDFRNRLGDLSARRVNNFLKRTKFMLIKEGCSKSLGV